MALLRKIQIVKILLILVPLVVLACAHGENTNLALEEGAGSQNAMLMFYREHLNHLHAVRSGECPMYPSCSEYSRQAMEKHGVAVGWIMTVDRLLRCGRDELNIARRIYINGSWRYYDPLENNDFWHTVR